MSDDRIQALVSGLLDRMHSHLQQELGGLADGVRALAADQRAAAADASRAEAESVAASRLADRLAAERAIFETQLAAAREEARDVALTAARAERVADLARADRLLTSVRALDAAESLSEVLDSLADAAAREAGRAVVLLVRGDELRGWAHVGYAPTVADARSITLAAADAGLFSAAIATSAPASTADGAAPAPFTLDDRDRTGIAAPLIVDDRVVALVYADDGGDAVREVPSAWPEHVELLARHASRCLEALTARQSVRGRPGAARREAPNDDESARRYARLLISEIKLYHEGVVNEGRRARDIRARLESQIARARGLYEARVPQDVRTHGDFFEQELVRTLADGDAALLGQAS